MAVPESWVKKTKRYLHQTIVDWMTLRSLSGEVLDKLGSQRPSTIAAPKIYIMEQDDYPIFVDDIMLVGFRLSWKYIEVQWSEAMEQLTDTIYDLTDYIYGEVSYAAPLIGGVRPPWVSVKIDTPDFPKIYDKGKGPKNNEVNLYLEFKLAVTQRGWQYMRNEI